MIPHAWTCLSALLFASAASAQGLDPCQQGTDDAFEENDSLQTAKPLLAGTYFDLVVRDTDLDYYAVEVAGESRLTVRDPDQGGGIFELLDASGATLAGPSNFVDTTNITTSDQTVFVRVRPASSLTCTLYDIDLVIASSPCFGVDDSFEPNDSCSSPTPLSTGSNFSLFASEFDEDYYSICLPDGESIDITVVYFDIIFALSLNLYDASSNCSGSLGTFNFGFGTDTIAYTNSTGSAQALIIHVGVFPILAECGTYDLTVETTADCSAPFSTYCTPKLSSIACLPQINATGAPSASSATAFSIHADDVNNFKNGILFYGYGGPAALPFFGGTLCVLPPLRRTPVQNSGGSTPPTQDCSGQLVFDFDALIQSGSDTLLTAGQGINAQYWFRDPPSTGGAGLSNGIEFLIGL